MSEIVFHNVYLRAVTILVIPQLVLFVQMIRNRKPGASLRAAAILHEGLTERGLRMKKWVDVLSAAVVGWIIVALVIGAATLWAKSA